MKILELQGLRGLAILSVLVFHYLSRWAPNGNQGINLYPYEPINGTIGTWIGVLWIGVELFFMISGFVIALSLSKTRSFRVFWASRFARLWPPLAMALPLVWLTLQIAPPLPGASKLGIDLLGSFTLIKPQTLSLLVPGNHQFEYTTGVLWTLWIEIAFYAISSIIYFAKIPFLPSLTALAAVFSAIDVLSHTRFWNDVPDWVSLVLSASTGDLSHYIWWFVAGVSLYTVRFRAQKRLGWIIFILAVVVTSTLGWFNDPNHFDTFIWANIGIFSIFSTIALPLRSIGLNSRPLVFLGGISYELYLIHEAVGLSFLQLIREWTDIRTPISAAAISIICVLLALIIYTRWSLKACAWTKLRFTQA